MKSNTVQIIDVSSYLYSGMGTSFGARAQYKGIPTGGVYGLLQQVAIALKNKDVPVLVFDSATNIREIMPEYKGSRSRNPKIRFQNDLVHRYIKPAISNSFKVEGFEADWIAYNIAEKYRANKKLDLNYRTVDYDWCHNIVSERDIMIPAVGGYVEVTKGNFENIFSSRDYRVPLNALTATKCFLGDKSDGVKMFKYEGDYTNEDLINVFVQFSIEQGLDLRSKETMIEFVKFFSSEFGDSAEEMYTRIEVLYPREMANRDELKLQIEPENINLLSEICSLTGCKSIANRLGIPFYEDMGELQLEVFREYQQKYSIQKTQMFEEKVPTGGGGFEIPDRGGFNL